MAVAQIEVPYRRKGRKIKYKSARCLLDTGAKGSIMRLKYTHPALIENKTKDEEWETMGELTLLKVQLQ